MDNVGRTRRAVLRRRIGAGALALLLVIIGSGVAFYLHLNGNLRTAPLTSGGHERANASGHTPINLLVIGSDTRASSTDCAIGGDCSASSATSTKATSAAANGDVLMVVHIAADRSNATIMSIPRDTMITVPACKDPATGAAEIPHTDRINSTLQYGADCTTAAVHQLTGIPIDHFLVIDFAGVVKMSDAIGGVPVCVDNNVYDPYSHLKLAKGKHTLRGKAALEFLRTRHGFGDGSDIGRTVAQHIFLSSMLRELKSASTLANPVKVADLANAATSAITVDTGLGSVSSLTALAYQLSQVPGSRTTFLTMPTLPDPANPDAVITASNAHALFTTIVDDTSLTKPPGSAGKPPAHPTTTSAPSATTTHRAVPTGSSSSSSSASTGDAHETTVAAATGCAQVGTADTVTVNGRIMTPIQAYAASPSVPNSAN